MPKTPILSLMLFLFLLLPASAQRDMTGAFLSFERPPGFSMTHPENNQTRYSSADGMCQILLSVHPAGEADAALKKLGDVLDGQFVSSNITTQPDNGTISGVPAMTMGGNGKTRDGVTISWMLAKFTNGGRAVVVMALADERAKNKYFNHVQNFMRSVRADGGVGG